MSAKKLIALLLAFVLCTGILAGCNTQPQETTNSTTKATEGTTAATEGTTAPVEVEYTRPDLGGAKIVAHFASTTVEEGECYVDRTVSKLLNCDWEIHAGINWNESTLPMIAEGKVPDLIGRNGYGDTERTLGEEGAFINYYDYLDQMPNVKAFIEDPANAEILEKYIVDEGVMYCLPIEREVDTNIWAYLYREDIFEKHNLTWPTNQEEFYNILVKLKELYPDSYPLVIRPQSTDQLGLKQWGISWGSPWSGKNVTFDGEGYYYGLISDGMKEMAQFVKKLLDEGLLHPSFSTIDSGAWNEVMSNNTSFICFDKVTKILDIAPIASELNPEWKMTSGEVFPMGTNGIAATSYGGRVAAVNYAIGNNDNVENTIKFVDWMYSPEGIEVTNWGIEGESYEVDANGNKQYKEDFLAKYPVFTHSGLNLHFVTARTTWDSYSARVDADLVEAMERGKPFQYQAPKQPTLLPATEEERIVLDTYEASAYSYALGEYMKFAMGQRDFAEWDDYVKTVEEDYGVNKVIEVYTAIYERTLAG